MARRLVDFCARALLCAALLRPATARASNEAGLADLDKLLYVGAGLHIVAAGVLFAVLGSRSARNGDANRTSTKRAQPPRNDTRQRGKSGFRQPRASSDASSRWTIAPGRSALTVAVRLRF